MQILSFDRLLHTGRVVETKERPIVVNPLSVSGGKEKRRLILDCRHINPHIFKERFKFDNWKIMLEFVQAGGYMFKFDLKQGYHHVEINPSQWGYLGYFTFVVLAFGIRSAPFIFTKIMRQLVRHWRRNCIKIACFLDDGGGFEKDPTIAIIKSNFVRTSLALSDFIVNEEKSNWTPCQVMTWLGVGINLALFRLFIPEDRASSLKETIQWILTKMPHVTARDLSRLTGKVISTQLVLGDITRLKTRHLYKVIGTAPTWDNVIHMTCFNALQEILFWDHRFDSLNSRSLHEYEVPHLRVVSDASATGIAAVIPARGNLVSYRNLSTVEESNSSTERELQAIQHGLRSFAPTLSHRHVLWQTDNHAATHISRTGSNKKHLQLIAEDIYDVCREHDIEFKLEWIPRNANQLADFWSRFFDYDDWALNAEVFDALNQRWGPLTIDRFADNFNKKLDRFNSRFVCPNSEYVNALSISWTEENNYVVPPVSLVIRSIKHMKLSRALGVLIVPYWPSAPFWPFIVDEQGKTYAAFVKDYVIMDNFQERCVSSANRTRMGAIVNERTKFLAMKVDFT